MTTTATTPSPCAWSGCDRPADTAGRPLESSVKTKLPMCEFHVGGGFFGDGTAWSEFEILQKDFLDVLAVMPLVDEAMGWWSHRLADILRRSGSAADSFLQEWSRCPGYPSPAKKNKKKAKLTIVDRYEQFQAHAEELTQRKVYVRALQREIQPWAGWSDDGTPKWWTAHNKVKHDAWANRQLGTLEHALYAVAAVFALHGQNPYSRIYLEPEAIREALDAGDEDPPFIVTTLCDPILTPLGTPHYLFRMQP